MINDLSLFHTKKRLKLFCQSFCMALLASCSSPSRPAIIEGFGNDLFKSIKQDAAGSYSGRGTEIGDKIVNWKTGREIPEAPGSDVKLPKSELQTSFQTVVSNVVSSAGRISDIKLDSIHYFIDDDPFARKMGILKFELVLRIIGEKCEVLVMQDNCALFKGGVKVGSPIKIVPSLPEYYRNKR